MTNRANSERVKSITRLKKCLYILLVLFMLYKLRFSVGFSLGCRGRSPIPVNLLPNSTICCVFLLRIMWQIFCFKSVDYFFPHSESILFAALGGSGRAGHRRRNSVRTLAARQYSTGCSPLCRTNPFQHRVTNMYRCLQWFHRTATLFPQLLYEQTDFFEARLVTICLEIFWKWILHVQFVLKYVIFTVFYCLRFSVYSRGTTFVILSVILPKKWKNQNPYWLATSYVNSISFMPTVQSTVSHSVLSSNLLKL